MTQAKLQQDVALWLNFLVPLLGVPVAFVQLLGLGLEELLCVVALSARRTQLLLLGHYKL